MPIRHVTIEDCGRLEGTAINPLYDAITAVCGGLQGEALWERIREKYGLGVRGPDDCEDWTKRMNHAIDIWNASQPTNCADIKTAYDV